MCILLKCVKVTVISNKEEEGKLKRLHWLYSCIDAGSIIEKRIQCIIWLKIFFERSNLVRIFFVVLYTPKPKLVKIKK